MTFFKSFVSELVEQEYGIHSIEAQLDYAKRILEDKNEPSIDLSTGCDSPYPCAFWKYCTTLLDIDTESKQSIFKLYRLGIAKCIEYHKQGVKTFEDIKDIKLTPVQQMQVDCTLNNKECINKEGVYEFLNKIKYPLYFLDFETMQDAIPQYACAKPYQQITFQYSLHYRRTRR